MNKNPLAENVNPDTYVDDAQREFEEGFGNVLLAKGDRKPKNDDEPLKHVKEDE